MPNRHTMATRNGVWGRWRQDYIFPFTQKKGWLRPFKVRSQEERRMAGPGGGEEEVPRPRQTWQNLVVVGAFAVFGDVEAFTLGILAGTQTEHLVDGEVEHR
jgi:hypothetical protein